MVWDIATGQNTQKSSISSIFLVKIGNIITNLKYNQEKGAVVLTSEDLSLKVYDIKDISNPISQYSEYIYFPVSIDICGNYVLQ